MAELLNTRQIVPRTMQSELKALKSQTSMEGVWNLLVPTQREAVFQAVVQVCYQLMRAHRGDEEERQNE